MGAAHLDERAAVDGAAAGLDAAPPPPGASVKVGVRPSPVSAELVYCWPLSVRRTRSAAASVAFPISATVGATHSKRGGTP